MMTRGRWWLVLAALGIAALVILAVRQVTGGSSSPQDTATAWALAVIDEDYVQARELSMDDATLFSVWEATTKQSHRYGHLETFTVNETQRSAQTTHFCVEFGGSDALRPTHFTNIYTNNAGQVSAGYPYTPGRCQ